MPSAFVTMTARSDGAALLERGATRLLIGAEGPRPALIAAREAARRALSEVSDAEITRRAGEASLRLRHPDAEPRHAEAAALAEHLLEAMLAAGELAGAWVQHAGAAALAGESVSLALPGAVLRLRGPCGLFHDADAALVVIAPGAGEAACAAAVIAASGDAARSADRLCARGAILGARTPCGALFGLAETALTKLDAPAPGTT
jgi:hypothetical protein